MNPTAYIGNNSLEYAGTHRADLYIDITDVIDKKVRAPDEIASQYYGRPYARKRAETSDGHYGNSALASYAEQFQRFAPTVRYTLPISDAELARITEPQSAHMGQRSEMLGGLLPLPQKGPFTSRHRMFKEMYKD